MIKKYFYTKLFLITSTIILFLISCARDLDVLEPATYPQTSEVFLDDFSSGLYYEAWGDVFAFEVDKETKYKGTASMKFAVPDNNSPNGSYIGGAFKNKGRDLSKFNALTFWAKASKAATINEIGFGNNGQGNKYLTTLKNVKVNTNWKKFIIPIPDASKLTAETGMLFYSEAPEEGLGYTFWLDEVKFEKLGTIAHPKPIIANGVDEVNAAFSGTTKKISGLSYVFNLPSGVNDTAYIGSAYFKFKSSNENVATVNQIGEVSILTAGTSVITATLNNIKAKGSLTVESSGEFVHAPTPTVDSSKVISLFSNNFNNTTVDYYNGYWQPYQTTKSADFTVNDDNVLYYFDLNFVGIQFTNPTINANEMTHLHLDILTKEDVEGAELKVQIIDIGSDNKFGTNDESSIEVPFAPPTLVKDSWISLDIPLSGLTNKMNLAQIILSGNENINSVYVDNIYFYKDENGGNNNEPTEPAPTPNKNSANVISLYSDAYNDLAGTDYPDWGQATVVSNITIGDDNVLKFAGLNYQGMQLASNQDISGMEYLHLDYWTDNSTALNIYLISLGPVEQAYALTVPTTGWSSVDIPLTSFSNVDLKNLNQLKFDGDGNVFLDNIYFYKGEGSGATEPTDAAPEPPAREANDVVAIFSGAYTDLTDTEFNPNWGQSTQVTTEDIAGNSTLKYSDFNYQGTEFASSQDVSGMEYLHIDMWTSDATVVKVSPINKTGSPTENLIELTPINSGQWNSYDIPLTDFTSSGMTMDEIYQLKFDGQAGVSPSTIYLDNIYFYKAPGGSGATEPTEAAPTPTFVSGDVVSLFSNEYTDVTVDRWSTDWDNTNLTDITVAGNDVKLYTDLVFAGIEATSAPIDASEMTHFYVNFWTPDTVTAPKVFKIKLVDFGADGAFQGGDDTEHELLLNNQSTPALSSNEWNTLDIPLTDFVNLTAKAHIAQIIIAGDPNTVYIDNMLFHK